MAADSTSKGFRGSSEETYADDIGFICEICLWEILEIEDSDVQVGRHLLVKNSKVFLICCECLGLIHLHCWLGSSTVLLDSLIEVTYINTKLCFILFNNIFSEK